MASSPGTSTGKTAALKLMHITHTPAANPDQFRYVILAAADGARHEHLFMEAAV
jgi:hypothetical protein